MAKIFKPRRATKSTMAGSVKKTTVLDAGEMMVVSLENSESGTIGGINKHNIYIGDGARQFSQLKPALYGDSSEEPITINASSAETTQAALSEITTGKKLGNLIGSLKTAIEKISISPQLNNWYTIPAIDTFTNNLKQSDSTGYTNITIKKDTEGSANTNPTYNKYYIDLTNLLNVSDGKYYPKYNKIIIKAIIPVASRPSVLTQDTLRYEIVCPISIDAILLSYYDPTSTVVKQSFRTGYFQEKGGSNSNGFGVDVAFYVRLDRIYFDRAYLNGHILPIDITTAGSMGLCEATDIYWTVSWEGESIG